MYVSFRNWLNHIVFCIKYRVKRKDLLCMYTGVNKRQYI